MKYLIEENTLKPSEFIELSKSVGWGVNRDYDMTKVESAIKDTSYVVVVRTQDGTAIGCIRAFSDDLLMTFIPDLFVDPNFQKKGIGRMLVEKVKDQYGHTNIFFGSQPSNEEFFENLGFEKSLQSYAGRFKENPYFTQ